MKIRDFLKDNIVILDGAMGTMLQNAGLGAAEHSEMWNISHPEEVVAVHKVYFDAGSNVVSTNTFGVNSLKYSTYEMEELISAAVENCKKARNESVGKQEKFIAFDVGPTGKMLKPLGDLDFDDAVEVFAESIRIASKYDVDLILIETMNDSYETKAALLAAKENCDLPVFVSNAYGEDGKLVTGASPEAMIAMLQGMGADVIGLNCSFGPDKSVEIVNRMIQISSVPVLMKPNAGLPGFVDGKTYYDVLPENFAAEIKKAVFAGVRVVGGCCGTSPEYISAVVKSLDGVSPVEIPKKTVTVVSSYTHSVVFDDKPVLIGERINPTGKKRFRQALLENDIGYILREGISQQDKGVHILDVNVGLAGINEAEMLEKVVKELQSVTDLPLQLDSSDPVALERAMRIYNGKALINSVNGKKESMDSIFPLVKKYGGSVIALTLDENGIPDSVDGRIEIAERILAEAALYGIPKEDIIFDPLTMTVSTGRENAKVTLATVRRINEELHCKTSLGVSNVSFGLPGREMLNSTFFNMALCEGLSAAIINPYSDLMMNVYYSYCALNALDDDFRDYISYADNESGKKSTDLLQNDLNLSDAVYRGLKEKAAAICEQMIKDSEAIDIINNHIIPALDKTGVAFENGTIYLPQLLISAEAASCAFEIIKKNAVSTKLKKCRVVLATVKGDVHDIGKNIAKLLLENYGYEIIDLGKDVEPQLILDTVVKERASLLGLSALMTTTLNSMTRTIELVKKNAPFCKIFVGGAVVNEDYAKIAGADSYTKDAMESVRFAESVYKSK